ncbi:MAG: DUF1059 domain-containing protein [Dehalococcoidia bacterium]|nr:DUF1059 domain-containing protein [Dehalococcoidia bacterium]
MAKQLSCRDMSVDCPWFGVAETVDELLKGAAEHSAAVHDAKDIPHEMMESMRRAVKEA